MSKPHVFKTRHHPTSPAGDLPPRWLRKMKPSEGAFTNSHGHICPPTSSFVLLTLNTDEPSTPPSEVSPSWARALVSLCCSELRSSDPLSLQCNHFFTLYWTIPINTQTRRSLSHLREHTSFPSWYPTSLLPSTLTSQKRCLYSPSQFLCSHPLMSQFSSNISLPGFCQGHR